jgi:hypothetical protein
VSRWQACLAPAAFTAAASAHFTAAAPTLEATAASAFEALLPASAVDACIATLTVIAEGTVTLATDALLAVAALRLSLVLVKIGALLVLV